MLAVQWESIYWQDDIFISKRHLALNNKLQLDLAIPVSIDLDVTLKCRCECIVYYFMMDRFSKKNISKHRLHQTVVDKLFRYSTRVYYFLLFPGHFDDQSLTQHWIEFYQLGLENMTSNLLLYWAESLHRIVFNIQGSLGVWIRPMRDDVTM